MRLTGLPAQDPYLASLPAITGLLGAEALPFCRPVTFFVGENGTGKSTLLEAIALASGFNAEGGTRNFHFHTKDTHAGLSACLTLIKKRTPKDGFFLRAESFYNVATELERLDEIMPVLHYYGGKSLHKQSHGESFLSLVLNRFGENGLYILDEPEAALSPSRQMTLLAQIHLLAQQGSQFIIATHSPILLTLPGAQIYQLSEDGIHASSYEDTEHYRITKDFLNNPQRMLDYLLKD
ncbi:MAG: AAA family ATPase [Oscillospiraceae bacterium]|nr:AAA family ATPase [Oscillospiraceae bacterium]